MTKEERAIKVLISVQSQFQASLDEVDVDEDCKEAEEDNTEIVNALDMAIEALKRKSCIDAVSREEAIMCLTGINLPTDTDKLIALYHKRLKALPPVSPKRNIVNCENFKFDEWDIGDKKAELWVIKGRLQIRHRGTIHNVDFPVLPKYEQSECKHETEKEIK